MTGIEERNVTPSDGYTLRRTSDGNGIAVDVAYIYVWRSNVGSLNLAVCRVEGFSDIYASYNLPTQYTHFGSRRGVIDTPAHPVGKANCVLDAPSCLGARGPPIGSGPPAL